MIDNHSRIVLLVAFLALSLASAAIAQPHVYQYRTGAGPPRDAPPPSAAMQRAEDCLRSNAGRLANIDPNLESAAGFLVNYICAEPVEAASRFQRNTDLIAVLEKASLGAGAKISVDPETGRLQAPIEPGKSPTDGLGAVNILQAGFVPGTSPSLKALAGQLILQARLARRRSH